jgi:hypothetical protein
MPFCAKCQTRHAYAASVRPDAAAALGTARAQSSGAIEADDVIADLATLATP